jgi:hypothetical protein
MTQIDITLKKITMVENSVDMLTKPVPVFSSSIAWMALIGIL